MEFMLLILNRKDSPTGETVGMPEMAKFAAELAREGKRRGGARLGPDATRVHVRAGKTAVTDGPFAESKEVLGGYFVIDADSRAEAIEIAKRCPQVRVGVLEMRSLPDRDALADKKGTKFMLLLMMDPDLSDPDGSKYREMIAFDEQLKREGPYQESSQLGRNPPAVRVETRGGKVMVTDGPFAETKEIAGGYYLVHAASRGDAVALAKRCPHAKWGTIEVRQVVNVGPA